LEEDGEEGLVDSTPPVAEDATESCMIAEQPVQADTSETSITSAPGLRRNRGRRRKWLAARAAAADSQCAVAPSTI